jgi:FixJ family two-component response regulator
MKEVLALRSGTKIVLISGDDTVRQDAMDAGATVFLKKPTDINVITETINKLMNS